MCSYSFMFVGSAAKQVTSAGSYFVNLVMVCGKPKLGTPQMLSRHQPKFTVFL